MSTDSENGVSSLFWDTFTIKDVDYIVGYDGLNLTKVIEDNENSVTSTKIHADGSCRYYFELTIENNPGYVQILYNISFLLFYTLNKFFILLTSASMLMIMTSCTNTLNTILQIPHTFIQKELL